MKIGAFDFGFIVILALLSVQAVCGIRFVIDREECFSHNVEYEGDTIHASFVVIKVDASWHYSKDGVDLVVSFTFLPKSFLILLNPSSFFFFSYRQFFNFNCLIFFLCYFGNSIIVSLSIEWHDKNFSILLMLMRFLALQNIIL